jgi:DNA (cytosine-5)-methyltransferase 1
VPTLPTPKAASGATSTIARVGLTTIEICAGGGGQALGLEDAGFHHLAVVELDPHACATLRINRPYWNTLEEDVTEWRATRWRGQVDLLAGGVPCPPFSKAGRQLGAKDERDLFPAALRLARECQPRAVMIENVRGLMDDRFRSYRENVDAQLGAEGYTSFWRVLNASEFGVPQLRPRTILVALRREAAGAFSWPRGRSAPRTVGETLRDLMASHGWEGAEEWAERADRIAPTLVGGSTKHGGPDLGPTRARRQWAALGVDGRRVVSDPPPSGFQGMPHLTVAMAASIQGFPLSWRFMGKRTHAYRQVGNAFPPPVARAVGMRIAAALKADARHLPPNTRVTETSAAAAAA